MAVEVAGDFSLNLKAISESLFTSLKAHSCGGEALRISKYLNTAAATSS